MGRKKLREKMIEEYAYDLTYYVGVGIFFLLGYMSHQFELIKEIYIGLAMCLYLLIILIVSYFSNIKND
jgi:hypothetical protein